MPTYDYECGACGHRFEHFQGISEPVLRKCPECRRLKLVRLIGTGAGILFKGSGFYETDYKRAGEAGRTPAGGDGKPGTADRDAGGSGGPTRDKPADAGGDAQAPKPGDGRPSGSGSGADPKGPAGDRKAGGTPGKGPDAGGDGKGGQPPSADAPAAGRPRPRDGSGRRTGRKRD